MSVTQKRSDPSGPMVCASTPFTNTYLGRMLVVPTIGHRVVLGGNYFVVTEVAWQFNDGPGEWEVILTLA